MGQYDFTYEFPKGFSKNVVQTLEEKSCGQLANAFQNCTFEYNDLGLAYYNGFGGSQDVWNKHAIDLSFDGSEKNINILKNSETILRKYLSVCIRPSSSGFLIHDIYYYIQDDTLEIDLPKETGDTFEVLSQDIYDALAKDEPTLVLDRLHTYASKFIREICASYNIEVTDKDGDYYPIHSIVGKLAKYYSANDVFKSEFVEQSLKMSISTFDRYNKVRNDHSYAHDNDVLEKTEAKYVISIVTATLNLIHEIEDINKS